MENKMKASELKKLRKEMFKALAELPQRAAIDDTHAYAWIDQVLNQEPQRAMWHVDRLFGIGGSEIGVLLGNDNGEFHPFSDARQITRQKLLLDGLTPPNGDLKRGSMMEDMAENLYFEQIAKRGAKSILTDDLKEIISNYKNEEHPWLVGNPDGIIQEKNGDVWIVDYKVPMPSQIDHIQSIGVPFYYEAQLHHYKLILDDLKELGLEVKGLKLCPLNLKTFEVEEYDVPVRPELSAQILEVGDKYWNNYVLKGRPAPQVRLRNTSHLSKVEFELIDSDPEGNTIVIPAIVDDEREDTGPKKNGLVKFAGHDITVDAEKFTQNISHHLDRYYMWRNMALEAMDMSETCKEAVEMYMPKAMLRSQVETIRNNGAEMRIQQTFDEEKLKEMIRKIAIESGVPREEVDMILDSENLKKPAKYDAEKLIEAVQREYGIENLRADPRFDTAISEPAQIRTDALLALKRKMDPENLYDVADTIDPEGIKISIALEKNPPGPLNDVQIELRRNLRKDMGQKIRETVDSTMEIRRDADAANALIERQAREQKEAAKKAREDKKKQKAIDDARKAEEKAQKAAEKAAAPAKPKRPKP
ncbi:YqaJ viral recombinase family protein [Serratia sp. Se-RSBMAAmG]|uniref:YqaJ viral recombinase family protein n=1 Tax=Serratia sp. Se-RSBMAAmG TaxID=3043305 RepID=UPI0024AF3153|nr:YqaJ viral recombinase family protein [Serratia sp. Se-RSBMAAmG]